MSQPASPLTPLPEDENPQDVKDVIQETDQVEEDAPNEESEEPLEETSETLYLQNLNDKVKLSCIYFNIWR